MTEAPGQIMKKKKQHYVSVAYLKAWCDVDGKVRIYRKDDPYKVIRQSPENFGFHKYYYAQPLPDGERDYNTLDDFFSEYESKWPLIVERIRRREDVNDCLQDIFSFIALQRARVPATRDAIEGLLADTVKAVARHMDAAGELSPKPAGLENILDHIEVSIDPHQSILAMPDIILGIGQVMEKIGISALINNTDIPFVTSDNPVIWFDPSVPEDQMQPYSIRKNEPILLLFPIAPDIIIFGHSSKLDQYSKDGFGFGNLSEPNQVEIMNRHICRFAYEAVFAQGPGFEELVKQYADVSLVVRTQAIQTANGDFILPEYIWGPREPKPKWERRQS